MSKVLFSLICFMMVGCTALAKYNPPQNILDALESNQEYIQLVVKANSFSPAVKYFLKRNYRLYKADIGDKDAIICFKKEK